MPGSKLSSLAIAFSLVHSPVSPAPIALHSSVPQGEALLKRVLRAEERVSFVAEQVVIVWSGQGRSESVSREYHLGPGKSRIEFLAPKDIAGRLVVNDGRNRWEYNPAERIVVRSSPLRHPVSSAAVPVTLSRVLRSYTLNVSKTPDRIAGRPVDRVYFRAKQRDREGKVWWVDRQTSVVLRRDVIDVYGKLRQSSVFRSVDYSPRSDTSLSVFVVPAGVKVVNQVGSRLASTYPSARKMLPAWARIPKAVGAGFEFDNARIVRTKEVETVQAQYSDGLVGLSLFLSPVPREPGSTSGGIRKIDLGKTYGSLMQPFPPYRVLSWTFGGKTYSLVADISEKTMTGIARKLL